MYNISAILDNLDHIKDQELFVSPTYDKLNFVHDDFNYAKQFLLNYMGSKSTYNTYRSELEKYLQWLWLILGKSILKVKRKEVELYLGFCSNPPKNWIAKKVQYFF